VASVSDACRGGFCDSAIGGAARKDANSHERDFGLSFLATEDKLSVRQERDLVLQAQSSDFGS
jgi:hypothetical protein